MKLFTQTFFFILLTTQICFGQWEQTNGPYSSPYDPSVQCFSINGTYLFAGTDVGGVFHSTNNGFNWIAGNSGLTSTDVYALAVIGTNLFAGTGLGGVFRSTNNGTNWTAAGLTNLLIWTFAVSDTNLFAGAYSGVFLSTNNGTSWTEVNSGLTNSFVNTLVVYSTNLFAGTYGGVFLSSNNGTSWTDVSSGLTNTDVIALVVYGANLFAGTVGNEVSVWRRPLSEMITSVEGPSKYLPTRFALSQNHPNPFNPSTKIKYSVPQTSQVQIKVYDVLGNEIETLINEEKPAGTYEVTWYAEYLRSGVYFYQLRSDSFVETKKMILMK